MKKWILSILIGGTTLGAGIVADNQVNPYVDKGTSLESAEISTLPEAGEVKTVLSKDEPKITLERWSGEVALGIRYAGLPQNTKGSRAFLTNRMEWKGAKEEMHAYPLQAGEGMEDGGFEIEIVLSEKPTINKFDFAITGADSLDFFFQPSLTQEEIDEGAFRPDNVIGSYAVYHKTKANHRVGSTNYATGKAYHIYRPKAIDANGVEEWAELLYENGVLSVTIPQSFLDGTMYPVTIDPTFGYTTIGGTNQSLATLTTDASRMWGRAVSLSETGTLDSLHCVLFINSGTGPLNISTFFALYREDSAGSGSHDLVASAETINLTITTTATFYQINGGSESLVIDDYILATLQDGEADNGGGALQTSIRYDTSGGANAYTESTSGAGGYTTRKSENPWTEVATASDTRLFSIYATYTASAGAATGSGSTGTQEY